MTTPDDEVVIRAVDCTKVFGTGSLAVTAVEDVSLTLRRGELVALVGPSGSGKTTLLSMLGALLTPSRGEIWVEDVDVTRLGERDRTKLRATRLGFVFQSAGLVPFLTARENVAAVARFAGRSADAARERADALLEELGLAGRADHLPHALSGGERQRVAIARALCNDPPVLLADEPTAHLDSERASQVVGLIADAVRDGERAGLVVTHDARVADLADRALSMSDGRLVSRTPR